MQKGKMNCLVTGAAGFIGSNLVHFLLSKEAEKQGNAPCKVVGYDLLTYAGSKFNLTKAEQDERFVFVHADILDQQKFAQVLDQEQIDFVFHLAAESHVDRSIDGPADFLDTNILGTFHLLEAVRKYEQDQQKKVRFLHVSTDEVYGTLGEEDPEFSETTAYAPNSPYSASKAASDHLVRAWHHTYGLDVVTTNCSNNYGPFQFPEKLIPLMILKALAGEKLPVYGDGSNRRDWLHVQDHVRALWLVAMKGVAGETYNIGAQTEKSNLEVVQMLLQLLREQGFEQATEELITFVQDRPGHDWRYAINSTKLTQELGWKAQESFASGLAKTVTWYLQNEQWLQQIQTEKYAGERLGAGKRK